MTIDKQLEDWEAITTKYFKEYKAFEFLDGDEKDQCEKEIQDMIKKYIVKYNACYDPMNPPTE